MLRQLLACLVSAVLISGCGGGGGSSISNGSSPSTAPPAAPAAPKVDLAVSQTLRPEVIDLASGLADIEEIDSGVFSMPAGVAPAPGKIMLLMGMPFKVTAVTAMTDSPTRVRVDTAAPQLAEVYASLTIKGNLPLTSANLVTGKALTEERRAFALAQGRSRPLATIGDAYPTQLAKKAIAAALSFGKKYDLACDPSVEPLGPKQSGDTYTVGVKGTMTCTEADALSATAKIDVWGSVDIDYDVNRTDPLRIATRLTMTPSLELAISKGVGVDFRKQMATFYFPVAGPPPLLIAMPIDFVLGIHAEASASAKWSASFQSDSVITDAASRNASASMTQVASFTEVSAPQVAADVSMGVGFGVGLSIGPLLVAAVEVTPKAIAEAKAKTQSDPCIDFSIRLGGSVDLVSEFLGSTTLYEFPQSAPLWPKSGSLCLPPPQLSVTGSLKGASGELRVPNSAGDTAMLTAAATRLYGLGVSSVLWTQTGGDMALQFGSANKLVTSISAANASGTTATVRVVVTTVANTSSSVDLTINRNALPIARPVIASLGNGAFRFSGLASTDPDGTVGRYAWVIQDADGTALASLAGRAPAIELSFASAARPLSATLTVSDDSADAGNAVKVSEPATASTLTSPAPIYPADSTTVNRLDTSLSWSGGSAIRSLQVEVRKAPYGVSDTVFTSGWLAAQIGSVVPSGLEFGRDYRWSVKACSGSSGQGTCVVSAEASFSTRSSGYVLNLTRQGSGSILYNGSASCPSACSPTLASGLHVTLTPAATTGWTFTGWSGACSGAGACTVTMNAAKSVTATFTGNTLYTLSMGTNGTGSGTIAYTGGFTCPSSCTQNYNPGANVTLTATPASGSTFAGWSGACTGTGTCTVTMNAAKSVTANFTANAVQKYPLTVSTMGGNGNGSVAVTYGPSSGTCPAGNAACPWNLDAGTVVNFTATAAAGSTFAGWSGACTGTGTCTVTMNAAKSVTANFTANAVQKYPLTVSTMGGNGNGSVAVTYGPSSGTCPAGNAACPWNLDAGTVVNFTATAAAGSTFTGWTGACSGAGACTVTMNAAKSVTANFTANAVQKYPLTVSTMGGNGNGSVAVTYGPSSGTCPAGNAACPWNLDAGTVVNFTATAAAGSTFAGWSGACTGTGTCTVTMNAAKSVTANFTANAVQKYPLTVSTMGGNGNGSVAVTYGPSSGTCPAGNAACPWNLDAGTVVNFTATAAAGSTFAGWSGACTGTGTCTVTMNAAKSVTANFTANAVQKYPLTVSTMGGNGNGSVAVTYGPSSGTCPAGNAACPWNLDAGTVVNFTATAAAGSTFAGWSGACTGTGTCTVTMNAAKSVTANFTANAVQKYPLTVSTMGGNGNGSVAVTYGPSSGTCPAGNAACPWNLDAGTVVNFTATAAAGSTFAGWSGACTGTGTCTVTMNAAKSVTANFTANAVQKYPLTVSTMGGNGNGSVAVTYGPSSGTCPAGNAACPWNLDAGTVVNFTATAAAGSTFAGWSGACTGTGTCTVTMNAAKSVTANFTANAVQKYPLTVSTMGGNGNGSVAVTYGPSSGTCPAGNAACPWNLDAGTVVNFTATAAAGSTFAGWSGACTGTGTCTVTMNAAKSVTANFTANTLYTLSMGTNGTGSGTIAYTGGFTCPSSCTQNYNPGANVTLTATPASGSTFAGWSGACTGTGTCTVTMNAAKSVTATFNAAAQADLAPGDFGWTYTLGQTGKYSRVVFNNVRVTNSGTTASGLSVTRFEFFNANGTLVSSADAPTSTLGAGESALFDLTWDGWSLAAGNYTLTITADVTGTAGQSNKANDKFSKTFALP